MLLLAGEYDAGLPPRNAAEYAGLFRQNALASALKEYGALRRDLLYAHEGMIRARHLETQTEQAWRLTLATNAVIAWTTEYYGLAVEPMRRQGRRIDDEVVAHISPAHSSAPPVTGHYASATLCSDHAHPDSAGANILYCRLQGVADVL